MTRSKTAIKIQSEDFQKRILDWYDNHRRTFPWKALPGEAPNPYYVWLSEIMLQQTTTAAVIPYFLKFIKKWPSVYDLAQATEDEILQAWAGLGYYARARNLHKCAKVLVENYDGEFPEHEAELKKLPGIGVYTSAAITAIAFNRIANVVDANVERIMARYFLVKRPISESKDRLKQAAQGLLKDESNKDFCLRPADYAQALMDLGATLCTPKNPDCFLCPIQEGCIAYKEDMSTQIPVKKVQKDKPKKQGTLYWIEDKKGNVLMHKRPKRGMLASMIGFPTSKWVFSVKPGSERNFNSVDNMALESDISAVALQEKVLHSFTHFDLELELFRICAENTKEAKFLMGNKNNNLSDFIKVKNKENNAEIILENDQEEGYYFWISKQGLSELGLPTLFKKAYNLFV